MFKKILTYDTTKKAEIFAITEDIQKIITASKIKEGTLLVYSMHTTLGLIIQEALEPNLCGDIVRELTRIVDDDGTKYLHRCADHPSKVCKTDDVNGPSHVRQALINQSIVLDIENNQINKGQFQDIGLVELDGPRKKRRILVKIIKD